MSLRVPMIRDEAIPIVPSRHCECPEASGHEAISLNELRIMKYKL
jgi:hypothetical protein